LIVERLAVPKTTTQGALPAARVEPHEKEVRDDRGGDEEHQRDRAEQRPQRTRQHVADDGIAERLHRRAKAGALDPIRAIHLGEDLRQAVRERREIALGVHRRNEIVRDWPEVDAIIVPIGGGGLIAGVSMAAKSFNPRIRVIGVESSKLETIDCKTIIDGLRVKRCGELNFSVVQRFVDEIVALPDKEIFEAVIWVMERCKLVVEGAAAAPVGALLQELVKLPAGSRVAVVLSGGNVNLDQLRGLRWN